MSSSASSAADTAAEVAKKGLGMMFKASKAAAAAIQTGIQKARKGYANKHEQDVLTELKSRGLPPVDHLVNVFKRLYYLKLANYKHELQAAALVSAKRLTDSDKTTVPLDVVIVLGGVLSEETMKYGDFTKSAIVQGMQDILNKQRMGKDHYDRDSVGHDVYYAVLILAEEYESRWDMIEACIKDAVSRTVEWAAMIDQTEESRVKAAKCIYRFAQAIKDAAQGAEEKRQRLLREAESTLRREQERRRPPPALTQSSVLDSSTTSSMSSATTTAPSAVLTSNVSSTTASSVDLNQNPYISTSTVYTPSAPSYLPSAPPYPAASPSPYSSLHAQ
ncbi:hypothetical protein R1sor_022786 [Riccia sorocarpa]|uniref:Uncharacterized protein n=1 Tax=Riccia sorocarpa TaxID=122646 RepID=A0ABD3GKU8_9MARC